MSGTAVGVLAVIGLCLAGVSCAGIELALPDETRPADVIVVLGGDGPPRAARAAELFRAGLAPRVVVTGAGDCLSIRDAMVERGVPLDVITVECESRSTYENAMLSRPVLAEMGARSALLVTSWFHLRRALACLLAASPDLRWMPVSAPPPPGGLLRPVRMLRHAVPIVTEGVKLAWYEWHYGVVPPPAVPRTAPEGASGASTRAGEQAT